MIKPVRKGASIVPSEAESSKPVAISAVTSGLLASFLLGWAPILGKFAYRARVDPLTLASLRTLVAAIFLWCVHLVFWRRRVALGWRPALSCIIVGAINGVGSLFYYSGLNRLDASRAALLGSMVPLWVVLFLSASGQRMGIPTFVQLGIALCGAMLVTSPWHAQDPADFLGSMLMFASAAINGWYIVSGQWVLADIPSQSGTLYIMSGMAVTVIIARFLGGGIVLHGIPLEGWQAILALGLTTALSRMAMFFSLARIGGVQTAILNLFELMVSLGLAFVFLGDRLAWYQWLGGALLLGGGLLAQRRTESASDSWATFDPMPSSAGR